MIQSKSLQTLLGGILDYAGLFPPAALTMDEAVKNYALYRTDERSWMLSRFICPASRLTEMEAAAQDLWDGLDDPWTLSVLGRGAAEPAAYLEGLREDLNMIAGFRERRGGAVVADALELPLPPAEDSDSDLLRETLLATMSLITEHPARPEAVFFEIGFGPGWERRVPAAILGVSEHARGEVATGVKIRTGGPIAAAVPSPAQVAAFVTAARDAGVFFKATAGLHHPLHHEAEEVGAPTHGFLNVFGGAVLSHTLDWGTDTLRAFLEEQDLSRFRFDEQGLVWGDAKVGVPEIQAARAGFAISFGSCSFTEPVEDLESLGLF